MAETRCSWAGAGGPLLLRYHDREFFSVGRFADLLRGNAMLGVAAIGMTFVILTAGIDLSIGSLLAFAGLAAAAVSKGGLSNRRLAHARRRHAHLGG